jgi:hypothetical protein
VIERGAGVVRGRGEARDDEKMTERQQAMAYRVVRGRGERGERKKRKIDSKFWLTASHCDV